MFASTADAIGCCCCCCCCCCSHLCRPIYFSICPHVPTPAAGAGREFSGSGQLAYAPPADWSAAQRHALANSILVEYVNTHDQWYAPKVRPTYSCNPSLNAWWRLRSTCLQLLTAADMLQAPSACRWVNGTHFDHECHGRIITNIDAMVQMTQLNYSGA